MGSYFICFELFSTWWVSFHEADEISYCFALVPAGSDLCTQRLSVPWVGFCGVGIYLVIFCCQTYFYLDCCHTCSETHSSGHTILLVPSVSIVVPVETLSVLVIFVAACVSAIVSEIWSRIVWWIVWTVSAGRSVKGSIEESVCWSVCWSDTHCIYVTVRKWII